MGLSPLDSFPRRVDYLRVLDQMLIIGTGLLLGSDFSYALRGTLRETDAACNRIGHWSIIPKSLMRTRPTGTV